MTVYSAISDKVQDDPFGIDQVNALNDNTKAERERQLRLGTNTTGVRMALARGSFTFNITNSSGAGSHSEAITFSSAADDGNPNFSAAPTSVWFGLEEDGTGTDWITSRTILMAYVVTGTLASSGMTVEISSQDVTASGSDNMKGTCYWHVIGAPTGTE
jgi:hypothetical protein